MSYMKWVRFEEWFLCSLVLLAPFLVLATPGAYSFTIYENLSDDLHDRGPSVIPSQLVGAYFAPEWEYRLDSFEVVVGHIEGSNSYEFGFYTGEGEPETLLQSWTSSVEENEWSRTELTTFSLGVSEVLSPGEEYFFIASPKEEDTHGVWIDSDRRGTTLVNHGVGWGQVGGDEPGIVLLGEQLTFPAPIPHGVPEAPAWMQLGLCLLAVVGIRWRMLRQAGL